jgi:hypothetical protein
MSSLKEADSSMAQRKERITNDTILPAARMWCEDSEAATKTYGHISEWDVSEVHIDIVRRLHARVMHARVKEIQSTSAVGVPRHTS